MKTLINLGVAALTAFMGAVLLGADPTACPMAYAASTGVLWGLIDMAGGVPGASVRR